MPPSPRRSRPTLTAGTRPWPCRRPRNWWRSSAARRWHDPNAFTSPQKGGVGMTHDRWAALLARPGVILADGAMGTMLFEAGLQFGDPPERWNLEVPERVRAIHRGYLEAGARLILTNTFGSNRFRLGLHRSEERRVGKECRSRWAPVP